VSSTPGVPASEEGPQGPPSSVDGAPQVDGTRGPEVAPDEAALDEMAPAVAPPSRRAAILRTGLIVAVLVVVFGLILPQYVDYSDVVDAFRDLTPAQGLSMTGLGIVAWVVSGLIFAALVEGLRVLRGTMSWLILSGIGSSVPLGPWNMGVLWVVVRGWGIGNVAATSGIALYGVVNILSRMVLPLFGILALVVAGDLSRPADAGAAWTISVLSAVAFIVVTTLIVAIVRSQRIADWLGRTGQRVAEWVLRRLGRSGAPDVAGAIHRFRDQLGQVIRRRGLAALVLATVSQVVWVVVLVAALRVCGVPESELSVGEVFGVYALVMVITILPIAPGGAGVPELLFISGFTALTGGQYQAEITAGVFLYRIYFWFVPIPLAWILMKLARRGKPILPGTAELKDYARGDAAA
jgi:putative heme transporter